MYRRSKSTSGTPKIRLTAYLTTIWPSMNSSEPKATSRTAGGLGEGEAAPVEGLNDFGQVGWRGPCPPPGHGPHRYFFRLHGLEGELDLPVGAGKAELERALEDRALAAAELVGTYER